MHNLLYLKYLQAEAAHLHKTDFPSALHKVQLSNLRQISVKYKTIVLFYYVHILNYKQ